MAYAGSIRSFDDPQALAGALHNCQASVCPTAPGVFRAKLAIGRLADIDLALTIETAPRIASLTMRADRIFFRFVAANDRPKTRNGVEDVPGSIEIGPAKAGVEDVAAGPSISRSLSVPMAALLRRAEYAFDGATPFLAVGGVSVRPSAEIMSRLTSLHREALALACTPAGDGMTAQRALAMNASIWDVLIETMAPADSDARGTRSGAAMRRLVDFISANDDRRISLCELCAVAGCSAKTLEIMFLRSVGETPNRYLRRWRMWRAREALQTADPANATVSEIAVAFGFWELGRFAVAYRQMFGESPSETLRAMRSSTSWTMSPSTKFA